MNKLIRSDLHKKIADLEDMIRELLNEWIQDPDTGWPSDPFIHACRTACGQNRPLPSEDQAPIPSVPPTQSVPFITVYRPNTIVDLTPAPPHPNDLPRPKYFTPPPFFTPCPV